MYANHPEMAKRWSKHTENIKSLPEKKKEEEKTAEQKALLFKLAAEMLSKRISNNLKVPLPSAINPKRPSLAIKPVQQNPLISNGLQYGANGQAAVQQKANQIAQQQAQPQKVAFLKKLAQGGIGQTWAAHSAKIVPPQHSKPVATVENEIAKVPEDAVKKQIENLSESILTNKDNLTQTSFLKRLSDPQNLTLETTRKFNALQPLIDPVTKREFDNPEQPLSAQMIKDYLTKDQQAFGDFLEQRGYRGKPYDWQKALTTDASEAASGPLPNFNPNYGALQRSSGGIDTEAQQQKRLAEEWVGSRIQAAARQNYNIPLLQALQSNEIKKEEDQRALGEASKRWTGIDETSLARLGGTIPEDLKVRARAGDAEALEQIKQLEQHYANRGVIGYAGDVGRLGWDMLNSNLGMLAGGFAGAGLKTLGRATTKGITKALFPRLASNPAATARLAATKGIPVTRVINAPGAVLEAAGDIAKVTGKLSTGVGLGTEALVEGGMDRGRAENVANTAALAFYGPKSLYDLGKSIIYKTDRVPALINLLPMAKPTKETVKNAPVLLQDLNPYSTQKSRDQARFDLASESSPKLIQDAMEQAEEFTPDALESYKIDDKAFKYFPKGFPGYMATHSVDPVVKINPALNEAVQKLKVIEKMPEGAEKQKLVSGLNLETMQRTGLSLEEVSSYMDSSTGLNNAFNQVVSTVELMREAGITTEDLFKQQKENKDNALSKNYTDKLTAYNSVAKATTEKVIPIIAKMQKHEYETQILPMQKELPAVAKAAEQALSDKLSGLSSPEGDQAINKAVQMRDVIRLHSYKNGMLSLMRSGIVDKAAIDLKMKEDAQKAVDTIEMLLAGPSKINATVFDEQVISPKTSQPVPDSQNANVGATDQKARAVLEAEGKKNLADSVNKESGNKLSQNPKMWSKLTNEIWNNMQPWEKVLTLGGLSIGSIGLFSSISGSSDKKKKGGKYLPLLGIAAGLAMPTARYFGLNPSKA